MTFAAEIVGAALGPLPFGLVYDPAGNYRAALLGVAILPLVATAMVLAAPLPGAPPGAHHQKLGESRGEAQPLLAGHVDTSRTNGQGP